MEEAPTSAGPEPSTPPAIQWVGQQVQLQTSFLAYMDGFWVLKLISLAAVPPARTLRNVRLGGAAAV